MSINNTPCLNAVTNIKNEISNCFDECNNKGSSFSGDRKLVNLKQAISLIPSGGNTSYAKPFNGFGVSDVSDSQVTINCGSIGASWRAITIYSNTKEGWFSIYKISNNVCIMSANPWYAIVDDPVLDDGHFPYSLESSSYRCLYTVSGSSITLLAESYIGQNSSSDISICCNQISNESQYMLDTIDVIY